jgi:hypothetical protein
LVSKVKHLGTVFLDLVNLTEGRIKLLFDLCLISLARINVRARRVAVTLQRLPIANTLAEKRMLRELLSAIAKEASPRFRVPTIQIVTGLLQVIVGLLH